MATQQQHSSGSRDAIPDESESNGIDRGEVFDLLSNQRRRYAIHYCKRQDDPVELGELAEHVAAWELDKEVAGLTSAERKRVYTSLQQTHLPTLDRARMVIASFAVSVANVVQNQQMRPGEIGEPS